MPDIQPLDAQLRSFCSFRLAGRLHGIEAVHVREISLPLPMTPVPQAPTAIRGLFNLRSRIYLGLDLRPLLGLPPAESTGESRLIILKPAVGQDIGVLVDQGGDIIHTAAGIVPPFAAEPPDGDAPLISGLCQLPGELLTVVDAERITQTIAKLMAQGRGAYE